MTIQNPTRLYKIVVQEKIKQDWEMWFNAKVLPLKNQECTSIIFSAKDQTALRGVMNKLWDLNLTIISLEACDQQFTKE